MPSQRELHDKNRALEAAEADLRASNRELEERVERRTQELKRLASTDPLTDVANRRSIMASLGTEIARAARYSVPVSVIMFDLDDFKAINDTHGHDVGDAVLKAVAKACSEQSRVNDAVGRYGGEEFVVVLPHTELAQAKTHVERVLSAIRAISLTPTDVRVSASAGVVQLQPDETVDALLKRADQAMYAAKAAGKNRAVVAEAG